jgi:hypothetical protein
MAVHSLCQLGTLLYIYIYIYMYVCIDSPFKLVVCDCWTGNQCWQLASSSVAQFPCHNRWNNEPINTPRDVSR